MTTATKTKEKNETKPAQQQNEVAIFQPPRLPYHDAIEERFNVKRGEWKVLVEAIFPAAKSVDAIVMALSYCQHRKLDIFKRPVHIVPMWSATGGENGKGGMVETVWPGISELRTTAARTGNYAGCDEVVFGPTIDEAFKGRIKKWVNNQEVWEDKQVDLSYPEWAQLTVYRIVSGIRCAFVGPKVFWREEYATMRNDSDIPNSMWEQRIHGQLEKCAEAAALRRAFPEEIGNDYAAEEMEGRTLHDVTAFAREVQATTSGSNSPPDPDAAQPKQEQEQQDQKPLEGEIILPEKQQEQPKAEAKTFGKKKDEPKADGPPPVTQPEKFRAWIAEKAKACNDGETLQILWDSHIEPNESEIFPPDYTQLQGIFNTRGKELAP